MATSLKAVLKKAGKTYVISYDEYGDMDTVVCEGVALSTKNRVVQQILNNEEKIRSGLIPTGFEKA